MASSIVRMNGPFTPKSLYPLCSYVISPSPTRSINPTAPMGEFLFSDDGERTSSDFDYRSGYGGLGGGVPPSSFLYDLFGSFAAPTEDQVNPLGKSSKGKGGDAKEEEDGLHVKMDMPGVGKEDVKVSVEKNMLIIEGEEPKKTTDAAEKKKSSAGRKYSRKIPLTAELYKIDEIKAEMKNGVLKVVVPKLKKEERKDVVEVKVD